VLASLDAELRAALEDLEETVAGLEAFRHEHDAALGWRMNLLARAKARLARLIADRTGDADDEGTADAAEREAAASPGPHGPAATAPGHRPRPEEMPSADEVESGEAAEIKRLYWKLARKWHPDRAPDSEKARYTRVFHEVHKLYKDGDLAALRAMWEAGDAAADVAQPDDRTQLLAAIEAVRFRLDDIHGQLQQVVNSRMEQLRQEFLAVRTEDRDLLSELAAQLDDELQQVNDAISRLEAEEPAA
jgi:hypothetical protein